MFEVTEEIARAQRALEIAMNHLNEATEREHGRCALDSAIHTVTAAELMLRTAVQRARRAEAVSRPRILKARLTA